MARLNRKTQVDDEAPVQHLSNQPDRYATIRKVLEGREGFAARHKVIKDEEKAFNKKYIKDALGMSVSAFNKGAWFMKLDENDRAEALDVVREIFTAVEEDGQVSFITDLQQSRADKAEAEKPSPDQAMQDGEAAGFKGEPSSACPWKLGRQKTIRVAWETGWAAGVARRGAGTESAA